LVRSEEEGEEDSPEEEGAYIEPQPVSQENIEADIVVIHAQFVEICKHKSQADTERDQDNYHPNGPSHAPRYKAHDDPKETLHLEETGKVNEVNSTEGGTLRVRVVKRAGVAGVCAGIRVVGCCPDSPILNKEKVVNTALLARDKELF
jgi:hypothetical protein